MGCIVVANSIANDIDKHVGGRVRARREALGISQGRLGRQIGLTFSQIQKYEKGANRIGAGRLYQIAGILGVTPSYFFEGLGGESEPPTRVEHGGARPDELRGLTEAFLSIPDRETRASVTALVRSLAQSAHQETTDR